MMKMRFDDGIRLCMKSITLICFTFLFLLSCRNGIEDNRPILAVSLEPQRNILENIAGDRFRIVTVMPSGDNPETFEPSPVNRVDIENCEAYFTTNLLPFETKLLHTASDKNKFVDISNGVELIYGTHTHSHGEGERKHPHTHFSADPHIWTSMRNAKVIARNMAAKLMEIDPENAEKYNSNLDKYLIHLDSIDNMFAKHLAENGKKAFLVWHPSLSYLAKDYGLEQIAVSSETKELSVSSIADVVNRAKADNIDVMFYQREYDNRQADVVGKSVSARMVPINPGAYYWENELKTIVDELCR